MMIQYAAISQDTAKVWIPRNDALNVLAAADSGRVYMAQVEQLKKDAAILDKIIALKQAQIDKLDSLDRANEKIIATYEKELAVLKEQRKLYDSEIARLNKEVRQERTKRTLTTIGAAVITALALWLGLTN